MYIRQYNITIVLIYICVYIYTHTRYIFTCIHISIVHFIRDLLFFSATRYILFWWMAGEDGALKRKTWFPANRLQLAACAAATFGAAGAYWFLVALGWIFMHVVVCNRKSIWSMCFTMVDVANRNSSRLRPLYFFWCIVNPPSNTKPSYMA